MTQAINSNVSRRFEAQGDVQSLNNEISIVNPQLDRSLLEKKIETPRDQVKSSHTRKKVVGVAVSAMLALAIKGVSNAYKVIRLPIMMVICPIAGPVLELVAEGCDLGEAISDYRALKRTIKNYEGHKNNSNTDFSENLAKLMNEKISQTKKAARVNITEKVVGVLLALGTVVAVATLVGLAVSMPQFTLPVIAVAGTVSAVAFFVIKYSIALYYRRESTLEQLKLTPIRLSYHKAICGARNWFLGRRKARLLKKLDRMSAAKQISEAEKLERKKLRMECSQQKVKALKNRIRESGVSDFDRANKGTVPLKPFIEQFSVLDLTPIDKDIFIRTFKANPARLEDDAEAANTYGQKKIAALFSLDVDGLLERLQHSEDLAEVEIASA